MPPCVSPTTISFWITIVSSSTGSVTTIAAAASGPHASCSKVSTLYTAAGSVRVARPASTAPKTKLFHEKMKASIAEHRNEASSHCVTPEQVKKPKEDFFGGDKSCRYEHFTMGGGKIDIQMVCKEEGTTQTTNMTGSYTPTSYSMDMSSSGSAPQGAMSMKMHVDSKRIGECSGKDG